MSIEENTVTLETKILAWITSLREVESLVNDIDTLADGLKNDCDMKKTFMHALVEDFNQGRNDFQTLATIQRDYNAESYIKELENTVEIIMHKYRKETQYQIVKTKLDFEEVVHKSKECSCDRIIEYQNSVINGLVKMTNEIISDGAAVTNSLLHENKHLKIENETLRAIAGLKEKFTIEEVNNNDL